MSTPTGQSPTPVIPFSLYDEEDALSPATPTIAALPLQSPPSALAPKQPSIPPRRYTDDTDDDGSTAGPSTSSHHLYNDDGEGEGEGEGNKSRDSTEFYPPRPLKSNIASREAEFEVDSDEVMEGDLSSSEPLLMEGLLQTGARRGSLDLRRRPKNIEEGEDAQMPDWLSRGGAGLYAATANMANSILGAGIIGLPYAFREAGLFMGLVLLVVLGMVTDWTIRLIVLNAKMSGRTTYIDIMDTCFGARGRAAVSFFQFTFAFGGMCAFCVILGDTIPHVLAWILPEDPGAFVRFLISRQVVITVFTLGISYPLSLYRDIEKLSKASALALISMVVIVVSVAIQGPGVDDSLKGDPSERWTFIRSGFFEAIGVISFAFVCHHNSLLIYGSLRTPTLDRFAQVTHISTTLSVLACLCMSTSGFLVFTDKTQGNILNNFSQDDTLINIARACFGANMFATLPLEAFVCREVLETYFWPSEPFNQRRHIIITTSLVLCSMSVSLITCDLGLILELAGGFSATALAYIFPAACFLSLTGPGSKQQSTRLAAWVCSAFGLGVMILSTFLSIRKALKGGGHKVCAA